jgi:type I restriction enzyme M protein
MGSKDSTPRGQAHDLPFAKQLWEACDRLRGSVESAEYKHLVLGLVFLKYISDSFERRRSELEAAVADPESELHTEDPQERAEILEDRDEYIAENVFWVPPVARWDPLLAAANQPDIGERLDAALEAVERENEEQLRGVLPRVYARAPIEAQKLGELVTTIAKVGFGDDAGRARDILGRTYEYFIREFARAEGHRGGEFFTPRSVVHLLVEMLEPYEGRVMDPACGSCGMFIQSAEFVESHGGRARKISIYGQEQNQATWRIGRMNLALHGLSGDIQLGDSLLNDQHPGLKADFVLANPPFNQDKWGAPQVADDGRWKYGAPPNSNANYAWIQHFIHHLAPDGRAGFVMANGSLTTSQSGEGKIREGIVRDDLVDCIVACPGQLFYTTQIPVCLWFLDRNKQSGRERDRRGEVLFIDARQLGQRISRTQIQFSDDEIGRIASTYHAWRGTSDDEYDDVKGFCASVTLDELEKHGFALTPGRYVGAPESEGDEIELEEKMAGLVDRLAEELAESERLAAGVRKALGAVGYEV